MMQQFMSRQFLVFLMTGGCAAAVNFFSRIVYNLWMSFSLAIIVAYITGMVVAFVLAKLFVFKEGRQSLIRSITMFVLVNIIGVVQAWVISIVLAYYVLPYLGVPMYVKEIAHAIGIAVPAFTSYLGHKYLSFR
jgi:putative flippase GtrA